MVHFIPHKFGIPQVRTRVYIVAIRKDLAKGRDYTFPSEHSESTLDVRTVLDDEVDEKYNMTEKEVHWLNMWEDFLINVNVETKLPGHPIWADAFIGEEVLPGDLNQYTKRELLAIGREWENYGWVKPVRMSMRKAEMVKAISLPLWKQILFARIENSTLITSSSLTNG